MEHRPGQFGGGTTDRRIPMPSSLAFSALSAPSADYFPSTNSPAPVPPSSAAGISPTGTASTQLQPPGFTSPSRHSGSPTPPPPQQQQQQQQPAIAAASSAMVGNGPAPPPPPPPVDPIRPRPEYPSSSQSPPPPPVASSSTARPSAGAITPPTPAPAPSSRPSAGGIPTLDPGVRYGECLKNHAASVGGHVVDGCCEFMPASEDPASAEALKCGVCGCHRSFHRKEVEGEPQQHCAATPPLAAAHSRLALPYYYGYGAAPAAAHMATANGALGSAGAHHHHYRPHRRRRGSSPPPGRSSRILHQQPAPPPLLALPPPISSQTTSAPSRGHSHHHQQQLHQPQPASAVVPPSSSSAAPLLNPSPMTAFGSAIRPGIMAMGSESSGGGGGTTTEESSGDEHEGPHTPVTPGSSSVAPVCVPAGSAYPTPGGSVLHVGSGLPAGSYAAPPPPPASAMSRKRFRTKFTGDQKDRMLAFADAIGWRMQRKDEGAVERFCAEVGVPRKVFKVWMHNNKHVSTVRKQLQPGGVGGGQMNTMMAHHDQGAFLQQHQSEPPQQQHAPAPPPPS